MDTQLVECGLEQLWCTGRLRRRRKCAYDADPAGYVARGRTARRDRRVGLRPASDTMSTPTGLLPVGQGVACFPALRAHTYSAVAAEDERTREQVMADTLVERLTGQATAADANIEVGIVMPLGSLLDPETGGIAEIVGHGPVPVGIAHDLLATTPLDRRRRVTGMAARSPRARIGLVGPSRSRRGRGYEWCSTPGARWPRRLG